MASGSKDIRIEKPFDGGVIVAGLEVIPASVGWVVVSFSGYSGDKAIEKSCIYLGISGSRFSCRYYHPRLGLNGKAHSPWLKTASQ